MPLSLVLSCEFGKHLLIFLMILGHKELRVTKTILIIRLFRIWILHVIFYNFPCFLCGVPKVKNKNQRNRWLQDEYSVGTPYGQL